MTDVEYDFLLSDAEQERLRAVEKMLSYPRSRETWVSRALRIPSAPASSSWRRVLVTVSRNAPSAW
jgi:hypothetical protein